MSFGFDLTNIEVKEFESGPMPTGLYTAIVEKIEEKTTKDGTGKYLSFQMRVCDMEKYNNKVLFTNINIVNQSEKAQDIGRQQIKSMLIALDIPDDQHNSKTPADLIKKKFSIFVKVVKQTGYDDANEIGSFAKVPDSIKQETTAAQDTTKQAPSWM